MAVAASTSPRRIAALLAVALMVVLPVFWVVWSLTAASAIAEENRDQAETLASLQTRLKALNASANADKAGTASVFLPGKSRAIAGAALQRIVANTVEGAGGRMVQSEIASSTTTEEEPGVVNLRAEFDTDIVGLQKIVHELETGAPILMVQDLTVETAKADAASENPGLSVVVQLRGHWET
jgi:hypothetical protein